jgi:hypothetical protein
MKRVALVLAAVTVTGVGIAMANAATNAPTTAPAPSQSIAAAASKTIHSSLAVSPDRQVHDVFARLTGYALSPGHLDHFTSLLDQSTRHRIHSSGTFSENYGKPLDAQIAQINTLWKQKYGHAFSTRAAERDFGTSFAALEIGTAGKDAKLAAEVMSAAGHSAAPAHSKANLWNASFRMNGDESIALANIKKAGGIADLHVPLACKSGGWWRVIASSSLTAEKLRTNLQAELADMTAPHAQWPASETDAVRQVTHRVMMAVMDKTAPTAKQTGAHPSAAAAKQ